MTEITDWECHKCGACTEIKNKDDWKKQVAERCKNKTCKHKRCKKCFDLDKDCERITHCGGKEIVDLPQENYKYVPVRDEQ